MQSRNFQKKIISELFNYEIKKIISTPLEDFSRFDLYKTKGLRQIKLTANDIWCYRKTNLQSLQ